MSWVIAIVFIPVTAILIWVSVVLAKHSNAAWDSATKAPKFIIKPSYNLGFDIWEKHLMPLHGRPPMLSYVPLYGQYKTREEAEIQLKHYQSNVDGSNDE